MDVYQQVIDATGGVLNHSYWSILLSISDHPSSMSYLDKFEDPAETNRLLELIFKGFYGLTANSFRVFKRLDQSTDYRFTKYLKPIYVTELGTMPLIEGTHYQGVPHPEQFRRLFSSLSLDGYEIPHAHDVRDNFKKMINLNDASAGHLLGYACAVELTAGNMISAFEDFISKWVCRYRLSHRKVDANFVHEHALLEGFEADDQHGKAMKSLLLETDIDAATVIEGIAIYTRAHHRCLNSLLSDSMLEEKIYGQVA